MFDDDPSSQNWFNIERKREIEKKWFAWEIWYRALYRCIEMWSLLMKISGKLLHGVTETCTTFEVMCSFVINCVNFEGKKITFSNGIAMILRRSNEDIHLYMWLSNAFASRAVTCEPIDMYLFIYQSVSVLFRCDVTMFIKVKFLFTPNFCAYNLP